MNFLCEIAENQYGEKLMQLMKNGEVTFGDIALFGGKMVLIGMGTIFAILTLLWGCLSLFKVFFYDIKNATPKKEIAKVEETVTATPAETYASDDSEIVAVIAAAIAAAESEHADAKFRVVSFRRK